MEKLSYHKMCTYKVKGVQSAGKRDINPIKLDLFAGYLASYSNRVRSFI